MADGTSLDVSLIKDEDVLRKMWQDTEDFGKKKEIRTHMYKLREARLRDFYSTGEVCKDIQRANSSPGLREKSQKITEMSTHADSLADHSFLSLKSKEIRDSESPTREVYKIGNQGWNVSTTNETTHDGKGHLVRKLATVSGTEKIDGGVSAFAAKSEIKSSVHADGDQNNFTKSEGTEAKSFIHQEAVAGDENSQIRSSSTKSTSSSRTVKEFKSTSGDEIKDMSIIGDSIQRKSTASNLNDQKLIPNDLVQQRSTEISNVNQQKSTVSNVNQLTSTVNEVNQQISSTRGDVHQQTSTRGDVNRQKCIRGDVVQLETVRGNQPVQFVDGNTKVTQETHTLPDGTIVTRTRYETVGGGSVSSTAKHTSLTSTVEKKSSSMTTSQPSETIIVKKTTTYSDSDVDHSKQSRPVADIDSRSAHNDTYVEVIKSSNRYVDNKSHVDNQKVNRNEHTNYVHSADNVDIRESTKVSDVNSQNTIVRSAKSTKATNEFVDVKTDQQRVNVDVQSRRDAIDDRHQSTTASTVDNVTKHSVDERHVVDHQNIVNKQQQDVVNHYNIVNKQMVDERHVEKRQPRKEHDDGIPKIDNQERPVDQKYERRQPIRDKPSYEKSKPTDGQYETTYRTDFTNKRISVDVSPTHDAFARSLRAVSPDRVSKCSSPSRGSTRTSTTSLRSSVSPEKHVDRHRTTPEKHVDRHRTSPEKYPNHRQASPEKYQPTNRQRSPDKVTINRFSPDGHQTFDRHTSPSGRRSSPTNNRRSPGDARSPYRLTSPEKSPAYHQPIPNKTTSTTNRRESYDTSTITRTTKSYSNRQASPEKSPTSPTKSPTTRQGSPDKYFRSPERKPIPKKSPSPDKFSGNETITKTFKLVNDTYRQGTTTAKSPTTTHRPDRYSPERKQPRKSPSPDKYSSSETITKSSRCISDVTRQDSIASNATITIDSSTLTRKPKHASPPRSASPTTTVSEFEFVRSKDEMVTDLDDMTTVIVTKTNETRPTTLDIEHVYTTSETPKSPSKDPVGRKSPTKEYKSPTKEHKSPTKDHKSPTKDHKSPIKEQKSPVKEQKSPTKEQTMPKSPIKEHKSPTTDGSPIKDEKSITKPKDRPFKRTDTYEERCRQILGIAKDTVEEQTSKSETKTFITNEIDKQTEDYLRSTKEVAGRPTPKKDLQKKDNTEIVVVTEQVISDKIVNDQKQKEPKYARPGEKIEDILTVTQETKNIEGVDRQVLNVDEMVVCEFPPETPDERNKTSPDDVKSRPKKNSTDLGIQEFPSQIRKSPKKLEDIDMKPSKPIDKRPSDFGIEEFPSQIRRSPQKPEGVQTKPSKPTEEHPSDLGIKEFPSQTRGSPQKPDNVGVTESSQFSDIGIKEFTSQSLKTHSRPDEQRPYDLGIEEFPSQVRKLPQKPVGDQTKPSKPVEKRPSDLGIEEFPSQARKSPQKSDICNVRQTKPTKDHPSDLGMEEFPAQTRRSPHKPEETQIKPLKTPEGDQMKPTKPSDLGIKEFPSQIRQSPQKHADEQIKPSKQVNKRPCNLGIEEFPSQTRKSPQKQQNVDAKLTKPIKKRPSESGIEEFSSQGPKSPQKPEGDMKPSRQKPSEQHKATEKSPDAKTPIKIGMDDTKSPKKTPSGHNITEFPSQKPRPTKDVLKVTEVFINREKVDKNRSRTKSSSSDESEVDEEVVETTTVDDTEEGLVPVDEPLFVKKFIDHMCRHDECQRMNHCQHKTVKKDSAGPYPGPVPAATKTPNYQTTTTSNNRTTKTPNNQTTRTPYNQTTKTTYNVTTKTPENQRRNIDKMITPTKSTVVKTTTMEVIKSTPVPKSAATKAKPYDRPLKITKTEDNRAKSVEKVVAVNKITRKVIDDTKSPNKPKVIEPKSPKTNRVVVTASIMVRPKSVATTKVATTETKSTTKTVVTNLDVDVGTQIKRTRHTTTRHDTVPLARPVVQNGVCTDSDDDLVRTKTTRKQITRTTSEKVMKPNERVTKPGEKVMKPNEKVIKPSEKVMKPNDKIMKPTDKVMKSNEKVMKPSEKVIKPDRVVSKESTPDLAASTTRRTPTKDQSKPKQKCITTKSIIINHDVTNRGEIFVDLHRSHSSREQTPDRLCALPVSSDDDYGTPRYPDQVSEPDDVHRKTKLTTETILENETSSGGNFEIHEINKITDVDRVNETDECLLTVNEKVNRFLNTAEQLKKMPDSGPRFTKYDLTDNQQETLSVSEKVNKFVTNVEKVLKAESYPDERPKSPRFRNYDENDLTVSEKLSKFINTAEKLVSSEDLVTVDVDVCNKTTTDWSPTKRTSPKEKAPEDRAPKEKTPIDGKPKDKTFADKTPIDKMFPNKTLTDKTPTSTYMSGSPHNKPHDTDKRSSIRHTPYEDETPKSTRRISTDDLKSTMSSTSRLRSTESILKAKALFENISNKDTPKQRDILSRPSIFSKKPEDRPTRKESPVEIKSQSGTTKDEVYLKSTRLVMGGRVKSKSPEGRSRSSTPDGVPGYMRPLNRSIRPQSKSPEGRQSRSRSRSKSRSRESSPEKDLPNYMKPLDRSLRPNSPHKDSVSVLENTKTTDSIHSEQRSSKFGVTLRGVNSEVRSTKKIEDIDLKLPIEDIYDLALLEEMLVRATDYELRRRIRAQIRIVKRLEEEKVIKLTLTTKKSAPNRDETKTVTSTTTSGYQTSYTSSTERRTSSSSITRRSQSPQKDDITVRNDRTKTYLDQKKVAPSKKPTTTSEYQSSSYSSSTERRTSNTRRSQSPQKDDVTTKAKTTSDRTKIFPELKKVSSTKKTTTDDAPEWITQKHLRKVSERKTVEKTSTVKKSDTKKRVSPTKETKPIDVITSSYGTGPVDENGTPLFGLKALRINKNMSENTKVQGSVIQSKFYSENGGEPVGEVRYTKYSTDPKDLDLGDDISATEGLTMVTTTRKYGGHEDATKRNDLKEICDTDDNQRTTTTKFTRRGSVKALSQKFIENAVETSKNERQTTYPKAGLILRTSSFKSGAEKVECSRDGSSDTEEEQTRKTTTTTVRSTATNMTSKSGDGSTFLTNRTRVTGVQDVINRMRNSEEIQQGDSIEDAEARTLLNKFLGSQVLLSGMEELNLGRQSPVIVTKRASTKVTTTTTAGGKPTTVTRTFKHPVTEKDLEAIWDEQTLRLLLEQSVEYEERRIIRAKLRQVMAEQEACTELVEKASREQTSSGTIEEKVETVKQTSTSVKGPITTSQVTTRMSSQQSAKKPMSPFAKFRQLDKQNSTGTPPGTPKTPTGTGGRPLFKFTDPALSQSASTVKDRLLQWCQMKTKEYENIQLDNFSTSWADGLAFCALIHHFLPDAFDYHALTPKERRHNFTLAFQVADEKADIAPLLDVDDMVAMRKPDWKCVFTYVQSIYRRFKDED